MGSGHKVDERDRGYAVCKIPKIERSFNRYTSLTRIEHYIRNKYTEERICYELNLLLELYEIGIKFVANKIYNNLTSLPKLMENMDLDNGMDIDEIDINI